MQILVTGSNGQLGSELKVLSHKLKEIQFIFTDIQELDICSKESVNLFFESNYIDFVINCAAYTAVDKAEKESELAIKINAKSLEIMAQACHRYASCLIHISTDYVFDGLSKLPYLETDLPAPNSVYGHSKLAGEQAINKYANNAVIIRTSWLYSAYGANFVKTMLRLAKERDELGVVCDQIGSPTYAKDLAETILQIIKTYKSNGVDYFHFSNEGNCSWYEFACKIFKLKGIKIKVNPIETKDFPTPAARPAYSLLDKSKIKKIYKISIPNWETSLEDCLKLL